MRTKKILTVLAGYTFVQADNPAIDNSYYTQTIRASLQGTKAYVLTSAPANLGSLVQDYGMMKAYENEATGNLRVQFLGTYAPLPFNADNKSILFMGAENKLYYPESGASIGAQRAYFKIGDETAAPRLTAFNINFGDGETTGIVNISKESGSCRRMVHPRRAQTLAEAHRPRYIYQQWSKGRD